MPQQSESRGKFGAALRKLKNCPGNCLRLPVWLRAALNHLILQMLCASAVETDAPLVVFFHSGTGSDAQASTIRSAPMWLRPASDPNPRALTLAVVKQASTDPDTFRMSHVFLLHVVAIAPKCSHLLGLPDGTQAPHPVRA